MFKKGVTLIQTIVSSKVGGDYFHYWTIRSWKLRASTAARIIQVEQRKESRIHPSYALLRLLGTNQ